jgi:hypothetical protein
LSHIEQCAAIAEIEAEIQSGETAEDSLFAVPEGMSHVESTMMFFNEDVCPDTVRRTWRGKRQRKKRHKGRTKKGQKTERPRSGIGAVAVIESTEVREGGKQAGALKGVGRCGEFR